MGLFKRKYEILYFIEWFVPVTKKNWKHKLYDPIQDANKYLFSNVLSR